MRDIYPGMKVKFTREVYNSERSRNTREEASRNGCFRSRYRISNICSDPRNIGILGIERKTGKFVELMNNSYSLEELVPCREEINNQPSLQMYPIFN